MTGTAVKNPVMSAFSLGKIKGLVKREYLDHKTGFFLVPLVIGGLFALMSTISLLMGRFNLARMSVDDDITLGLGDHGLEMLVDIASGTLGDSLEPILGSLMLAASVPVLMITPFVIVFGLLSCLFDDRKDRSYLFWKSMPVSDSMEVMTKFVTMVFLGPLVILGIATLLQWFILVTAAIALGVQTPLPVGTILMSAPYLSLPISVYLQYVAYILMVLPLLAWLLLVSSWAPKAPLLFAAVPPVAVGVFEALLFNTHYFANWIANRVEMRIEKPGLRTIHDESGRITSLSTEFDLTSIPAALGNLGETLVSADFLVGAVIAVALFAGAIWQRRYNV